MVLREKNILKKFSVQSLEVEKKVYKSRQLVQTNSSGHFIYLWKFIKKNMQVVAHKACWLTKKIFCKNNQRQGS